MNLKQNINKIHSDLLSSFKDVNISEKESLQMGNYFEITVNEGKKELKAIVTKRDLENSFFNWRYYSDPDGELSHLVERDGSVDNFASVVKDIFDKNRFDSDYLKRING